jgi:Uma2 family endonuclease
MSFGEINPIRPWQLTVGEPRPVIRRERIDTCPPPRRYNLPMSISTPTSATYPPQPTPRAVVYPESDGAPIADNTIQFRWIVTVKGNLDILYDEQADVFVAGDLFWYPVEGDSTIVQGPDVFVAFGRGKGERRSYKQWEEGGIAPQVIFEILSHNNVAKDLVRQFAFYEKYGVEEYYVYDPEKVDLTGYLRAQGRLEEVRDMSGWVSPRLQCRFQIADNDLVISGPDSKRFLTFVELGQRARRLENAAAKLRDQLRALGVEPQA